jgi:hypothetical protein
MVTSGRAADPVGAADEGGTASGASSSGAETAVVDNSR